MIKSFILLVFGLLLSVVTEAKNYTWQNSSLQLSKEQVQKLNQLETAAEIIEGKLMAKLDGDWKTFMNAKALITDQKEKMIEEILTKNQYQTYLKNKESLKKKKR